MVVIGANASAALRLDSDLSIRMLAAEFGGAPRLGSQRLYRTPIGGNVADKREITVERVFELMDGWRHLPAYQLERRADIFFAMFLPEVLRKRFHLDQNPVLIPEFPVKKSRENNQPSRIDYLALECRKVGEFGQGFLVELKTDMGSRRENQDRLLHRAASLGMKCLVKELLEVCGATSEKLKYVHLLYRLSRLGLVTGVEERICSLWKSAASVDPGDDNWRGEASKRGKQFAEQLRSIELADISWPSLEVVYVQPHVRNEIVFEDFAKTIEKSGKIGRLFATSLRKWTDPAGSPNPKDLPPC